MARPSTAVPTSAMAQGTLIAESLRLNEALAGPPLHVQKVTRVGPLEVPPEQPALWTFIEFNLDDSDAGALAEALAGVLDADLGWYCDFRTRNDTVVVFAGKVFRYPRGDADGRARAAAYARPVGVPEAQLDWPE